MIKKEVSQKNYAKSYIIAVLLITWLVTAILFINPAIGLNFFSLIMFIPAILVMIFNTIQHKSRKERHECFTKKLNLGSLLFGMLYPIFFVLLCAIIAQIINIGKFNPQKAITIEAIITTIINILAGLIGALGEEYGWRGYLLPELTKIKGKTKASIIVGIVWALFHIPAVFLLAKTTGMSNPLLLCIIQAGAAFAFSFPFSYCYYLSGNIIPVLLLHAIWNIINPAVLGNIYSNKKGVIEGNLLYINGEGVLGLVLGAIFICWFVNQLKKNDYITNLKLNGGVGSLGRSKDSKG